MAAKKKLKKKSPSRKASAPGKAAKAAQAPRSGKSAGSADETSAVLRESAKSFAFRLLR